MSGVDVVSVRRAQSEYTFTPPAFISSSLRTFSARGALRDTIVKFLFEFSRATLFFESFRVSLPFSIVPSLTVSTGSAAPRVTKEAVLEMKLRPLMPPSIEDSSTPDGLR